MSPPYINKLKSLPSFRKYFLINVNTIVLTYVFIFPIFSGPFFRDVVGSKLVWVYFIPVNLVCLFSIVYYYSGKHKNIKLFFLSTAFFLLILTSTFLTGNIMPLFFYLNLFTFIYYSRRINEVNKDFLRIVFLLILVIAILLSFTRLGYNDFNRFSGFSSSPTTFGVYLIALFIFVEDFFRRKSSIVLIYGSIFILLYLTKTRLNILFFTLLPFLYLFLKQIVIRRWVLIMFIVALIFTYPLYNYLSITTLGEEMVEMRYEDGRDASAQLRLALFDTMLLELMSMDLRSHFFGKGSEYSRTLIEKEYDMDIQPHNDFVRLYLDFGFFVSAIYLLLLSKYSLTKMKSFVLLLLYLMSFFHNMVFNFHIAFLLIFSIFFTPKPKREVFVK